MVVLAEERQFTNIQIVKSDSPENVNFLMRGVKLPWKDLEPGDSFFVPVGFFPGKSHTKTPRKNLVRSRIHQDLSGFVEASYKVTGIHRRPAVRIHQVKDQKTGELLGMRVLREHYDVIGFGRNEKVVKLHKNEDHSSPV